MKILFLSDNFPPEVNAPASRTYEHCREWVRSGAEVTVITCAPNFPKGKVYKGYKNKLWQKEWIDGIRVIRVWSYIVPNKGLIKRTLDFISYSVSSFIAGLFIKTDIIVATSPQFFTALSGRTLSFWKRKPWIMEVRDLWPESIKTVGAIKDNLFIRYFEWEEKRCYKSAKHIVGVVNSFIKQLGEKDVPSKKISIIKNGVDRTFFRPMEKDANLISELKLQDKTIIGYIGTHGLAHKLDFIINIAAKLKDKEPSFHFLFIGNGAEKDNLLKLSEKLGCNNVTMLDSVPKSEVRRYISILDISLINLRKSELFTGAIPSKIFENASMEIPILLGVEGEAKNLIEYYNAGLCFEPENETDFIDKLRMLKDAKCNNKYKEGCHKLAQDFDRKKLAREMLAIIAQNL